MKAVISFVVAVLVLAGTSIFLIHLGKWDDVTGAVGDIFGESAEDAMVWFGATADDARTAASSEFEQLRSGQLPEIDWDRVATSVDALLSPTTERHPSYDRDEFGAGWLDLDGDGCDTRNEVLARDLTSVVFDADGCTVLAGSLADPYTAAVINFTRGQDTSGAVQIDHIVPLSLAWDMGAWRWSDQDREQFANDPGNLLAVDGPTNGSKGDSSLSEWLPPNTDYICTYTVMFVTLTERYELAMSDADKAAAAEAIDACK